MNPEMLGGGFIVALGAAAMFLCLREMMLAFTSARWPQVEGVFRDVDLVPDENEQDHYHATVTYTYRFQGQDYAASRLRFGDTGSFSDKPEAPLKLKQMRIGHPCTVYVDPARPARAVLLPGLTGWSFIPPIVPCILIGVGAEILSRMP